MERKDDLDATIRARVAALGDWDDIAAKLAGALIAVLELHEPRGSGAPYTWCGSCRGDSWPCGTVRAIAEKLGVEVDRADPA